MEFRFEDPTPRTRNTMTREVEEGYATRLRENPGRWARVGEKPNVNQAGSLAALIKKGERAAYRLPEDVGRYEATTRTVNGVGVVYARFVPAED